MFKSFFQAGFEGTTGYNRHGQWIDQIAATQHDRWADEDYARLRDLGILTVRESVRWPYVDHNNCRYDFSSVDPFLAASERHGIEIIHDLFHFGYPGHIDLFSADFPKRFAGYCYAVADYIASQTPGVLYFTPINEPSFFSWAAGEMRLFAPHATGRGWELKVRLAEAAIKGINAIRAACPGARIVNVDPLCHVAVPIGKPDMRRDVDHFNSHVVFQGWDMIAGRLLPELGGSREHLDIIGVNYYWTNQWELGGNGTPLNQNDPRRVPLGRLLRSLWERYGGEVIVTETSHVDEHRAAWLRELAAEMEALLKEPIPLHGICLYPVLSMPEWHARGEWAQMGLWNLEARNGKLERVLHRPMLEALVEARRLEEIARDG
ncbi:MAG: glycoside hydrolase [Blastocatellales bacterium]